jgi:hypothetical protein
VQALLSDLRQECKRFIEKEMRFPTAGDSEWSDAIRARVEDWKRDKLTAWQISFQQRIKDAVERKDNKPVNIVQAQKNLVGLKDIMNHVYRKLVGVSGFLEMLEIPATAWLA